TPVTRVASATSVESHRLHFNEAGYAVERLMASDIADYVALVDSAYRGESAKQGWTSEADIIGGQRLDAEMAGDMLAEEDRSGERRVGKGWKGGEVEH